MEAGLPSRDTIEAHLAKGEYGVGRGMLAALFESKPTLATAQYVTDRFLRSSAPRTPLKVAILRSYTVEPMVPLLRARAALLGLDLSVHVGEFGAYNQELLDASGALSEFAPDVVVVAVLTDSAIPDVWRRATELGPEALVQHVDEALAQVERCLGRLRERSKAHVILHTLDRPMWLAAGLLDEQSPSGQVALVQRYNDGLRRIARGIRGVYVLDFEGVAAAHGRARFYDPKKALTMGMPLAHDALLPLADAHMRIIAPIAGKSAKVLVLDLDNTLWGGVVGEDGVFGVKIGSDYPGAGYQELQRAALDLSRRGILLAIASKNNPPDVEEVFAKRKEMLLRLDHFAAVQIHWNDKATSLRAIAAELNVGIDALAFVDDNPVERQRIELELPDVHVISLPTDPMGYAAAVRSAPVFERLTLSSEDKDRSKLYVEQRQRSELEKGAASVEDYYRSLQMVATISAVGPGNLARVAQLTQKTNQFNLTTRRYSDQEIELWAAREDARVFCLSVRDRFGDSGLVGVAIVSRTGGEAEVDTLLLSCRVIGRTVETAMLAHIVAWARDAGVRWLQGSFIPTKKNAPASDFYARHGFARVETSPDGDVQLFRLDVREADVRRPEWIVMEEG